MFQCITVRCAFNQRQMPFLTVDHNIKPSEFLFTPPKPQDKMGFDEVREQNLWNALLDWTLMIVILSCRETSADLSFFEVTFSFFVLLHSSDSLVLSFPLRSFWLIWSGGWTEGNGCWTQWRCWVFRLRWLMLLMASRSSRGRSVASHLWYWGISKCGRTIQVKVLQILFILPSVLSQVTEYISASGSRYRDDPGI